MSEEVAIREYDRLRRRLDDDGARKAVEEARARLERDTGLSRLG